MTRKALAVFFVALACAAVARAQKEGMDAALRSLVEAERAFARTSVEKGTRAAFLAFIADDGIIFRPGPVNGKKSWTERAAAPGVLTWEPVFADISRAGDLGYTTGPWEFREKSLQDKPVAYGYYVTLWRKQPDGSWKFALDIGTSNPEPNVAPPALRFPPKVKIGSGAKADAEAARAALLKLDADFSQDSSARGSVKAYDVRAAEDVRLHRTGALPVVGKSAARSSLEALPGALTWRPLSAEAARSTDLAYTYGTYDFKPDDVTRPAEQGHYLRIWKRQSDGAWRVALDLLNPQKK